MDRSLGNTAESFYLKLRTYVFKLFQFLFLKPSLLCVGWTNVNRSDGEDEPELAERVGRHGQERERVSTRRKEVRRSLDTRAQRPGANCYNLFVWRPFLKAWPFFQKEKNFFNNAKRSSFFGSVVNNLVCVYLPFRLRLVLPMTTPKQVNLNLIQILLQEVKVKRKEKEKKIQRRMTKLATKTRIVWPRKKNQFKHKVDFFRNVFAKIKHNYNFMLFRV